jgi:hypothetical protein
MVLADIVDGATIIWIDQAKIPHLRALIGAGYPRGDDLHEGLREGVEQATRVQTLLKGQEVFQAKKFNLGESSTYITRLLRSKKMDKVELR